MLSVIIIFLGLSVFLYVLLGGADFGAGIIEIFSRRRAEKVTTHAIGPVWEANHMWLILIVVILFMGFPRVYALLSTALHIPITLMLVGIILRGTAFTFRHYDAIRDASHNAYTKVFHWSSLITSFFLGILVGAVTLGRIAPAADTFHEGFIAPWLNFFCFSLGLFVTALFAFLAAVYLIGETEDETLRSGFLKAARTANIAVVISGTLVFLSAWLEGLPLIEKFLSAPLSAFAIFAATASLPLLWRALRRRQVWLSRFIAGAQVLFIVAGWFGVQFPLLALTRDGGLSFYNAAAPEATLRQLGLALLVGSLFILPSLAYLFKIFKLDEKDLPR